MRGCLLLEAICCMCAVVVVAGFTILHGMFPFRACCVQSFPARVEPRVGQQGVMLVGIVLVVLGAVVSGKVGG
eukprot:4636378-Amphidinium_carterae.1